MDGDNLFPSDWVSMYDKEEYFERYIIIYGVWEAPQGYGLYQFLWPNPYYHYAFDMFLKL